MECGEVDLAKLLTEKQGEPVDFPWVTSYWHQVSIPELRTSRLGNNPDSRLQMLQAVQVIHEEKIVHSDLKPANFVLVKGSLKLIDFGIAKAIPNDTTNIQREQQVCTISFLLTRTLDKAPLRLDWHGQLHEPRSHSRHPRDERWRACYETRPSQ